MPNIKASIKDLRKTKKRTEYNRGFRSHVRTIMKRINLLLSDKAMEPKDRQVAVETGLRGFFKVIDKAVGRGVIKKNTAARHKSNLSKKANRLQEMAVSESADSQ